MAASSTNGAAHALAQVSWPLAVLGIVSGSLSWGLLALFDALGIDFALTPHGDVPYIGPLSTLPGLVFGLVVGGVLIRQRGIVIGRFLGYVLASVVGYLAAYHAAFFSVLWLSSGSSERDIGLLAWVLGGMLGGLAGTVVLGLASKFLLRAAWLEVMAAPVVAGTLAGAALLLWSFDTESRGVPIVLLVFFALWQGAYAATLAPLVRRRLSDA